MVVGLWYRRFCPKQLMTSTKLLCASLIWMQKPQDSLARMTSAIPR